MKKIITAINNPKLNEELKKEKNFEVIGKDIQYTEAIIELLEKNSMVDLIIISEEVPGEIKIENLIKKIRKINDKIKIIYILEKENSELEKILIRNKIKDIYYNNKINLKELINIINKKEINMEEEIIKLRKIIDEKNQLNNKRKIKNKKNILTDKKIINKTITISGNNKSGKSTIAFIMAQILANENYKVLLVDGDLEKQDLSVIIKSTQKENIISKKLINFNKKKEENQLLKLNKNLYFLSGIKNSEKEEIKIYHKIINFLKQEKEEYNFIIIDLSKNNLKKINKNIVEKSDINFVLMEANLLGLREVKSLIKVYKEQWKIPIKNLVVIMNKKNFLSMNKELIFKIFPPKIKIYEIKENKNFSFLINNLNTKIFLLKNKKIKKQFDKIIKIIK